MPFTYPSWSPGNNDGGGMAEGGFDERYNVFHAFGNKGRTSLTMSTSKEMKSDREIERATQETTSEMT